MQERHSSGKPVTRRGLIAGATVSMFVLAARSGSAQRCPPMPPARTKGPLVWLDMDQQDIDEAYDQSVYAFNAKNIDERRAYNNEIARTVLGDPHREAYGPTEIEKVDIYKTKRANGPIMIFIHGGSWHGGRSNQFTVYAEPFVKAGANFVVVRFHERRRDERRPVPDGRPVPPRGRLGVPKRG